MKTHIKITLIILIAFFANVLVASSLMVLVTRRETRKRTS